MRLYLDASGDQTKPDDAFAVGGYLAAGEQWAALAGVWGPMLARDGLPYFRMSDCLAGTGPFAGMKDEEARFALAEEYIDVINRHAAIGLGVGVRVRDYNAAFQEKASRQIMTHRAPEPTGQQFYPVAYCLRLLLEQVARRITDEYAHPLTEQVAVILEQGEYPQALAYCDWLVSQPTWCPGVYGSFTTGQKRIPGLQAGDIAANRARAALLGADSDNRFPLDRWMQRLWQLNAGAVGGVRADGDLSRDFRFAFSGPKTLTDLVEALRPFHDLL